MPTDTAALKAVLRQSIAQAGAQLAALEVRYNVKSLGSEVEAYEDELGGLVQELLRGSGRLSKADFRKQMKSAIKQYAESVAAQGWEEGGGDVEDIGPEELELIQSFYSEQQSHVNDFSDWLKDKESDLDDANGRVETWASGMENLGQQMKARAMGDPSIYLDGDDGENTCDECQEYQGKENAHRMSWWSERGLLERNGNKNYGCGRWDGHCRHSFYFTKSGELAIA